MRIPVRLFVKSGFLGRIRFFFFKLRDSGLKFSFSEESDLDPLSVKTFGGSDFLEGRIRSFSGGLDPTFLRVGSNFLEVESGVFLLGRIRSFSGGLDPDFFLEGQIRVFFVDCRIRFFSGGLDLTFL